MGRDEFKQYAAVDFKICSVLLNNAISALTSLSSAFILF
jgi:hypothetical protein